MHCVLQYAVICFHKWYVNDLRTTTSSDMLDHRNFHIRNNVFIEVYDVVDGSR
jgi:hypothetical protein